MKPILNEPLDLDQVVPFLDELPLWSAPFGLKLLEYIDYRQNISVLDIGFGTGFPLTEIAMRLDSDSTVYGIDPWKVAADKARQKLSAYGITNVEIIDGVAESIPLSSDSVDLIVSNNGLNNVNDLDKVLSECSRISRSGGQFVQTLNLDKSMFEFYTQFEKVLSDLQMVEEIEAMHRHIYEKRRPLTEIISLIQKYGFIIKDLEHDQFDYRFASGTAMLNHHFIRLAFMDSWIKLVPYAKREQIFNTIETALNEQSRLLGGIKLSIPFAVINAIKR